MINVYNENSEIVARVNYSNNLDYWDGRNWTCGSTGRHKGITQLKDGQFVLIFGTQWQGEQDSAEIISEEQAIQEILRSDSPDELLKKFHLTEKAKKTLVEEA